MMRPILFALTLTLFAFPAWALLDRGDGIHTETWFLNQTSFYELPDEVATAAEDDKTLVMIWEQEGCGSCLKLHEVNFQDPKLRAYLDANFAMMSNNIFGEIEVTDFDGVVKPEKDLAADLKVHRSPTTVFFNAGGKEVFTLPGYHDPARYLAAFVFVKEKGYADTEHKGNFLRWFRVNKDRVAEIYAGL